MVVDGIHEPTVDHRNDLRTFTYPTVGIPKAGSRYNSTKIVLPEELYDFDTKINTLFKPFNDSNC